MIRGRELICIFGACLLCGSVRAVVSDSADQPYHGIIDRNVFDLKPPTPPQVIKPPAPPVPSLKLTGITSILGRKIALITAPPSKPGAQPESYMLGEGEAQNGVEVLKIDENGQTVQVNNHGTVQPLDFLHDGATPVGPPVQAAPVTTAPGGRFPFAVPHGQAAPAPGTLPMGRPMRLPGMPSAQAGPGSYPGNFAAAAASVAGVNPNSDAASSLTGEQRAVLIELERQKYRAEGNPLARLLPPTQFTAEANKEADAAANPPAAQQTQQPQPSAPASRYPFPFPGAQPQH